MKFFSFWRSLASFRVRIALNLKRVPAEVSFVDLDADAHRTDDYRRLNPQMALPALVEDDGTVLFQSLAIVEYLDEKYPEPPLLPKDAAGRARVCALALMVACEGHPLLVPRVRRYLDRELNLRDEQQIARRAAARLEPLHGESEYAAERQSEDDRQRDLVSRALRGMAQPSPLGLVEEIAEPRHHGALGDESLHGLEIQQAFDEEIGGLAVESKGKLATKWATLKSGL